MKVTIYIGGMMGVHKTEATLIDHGRKPYAQYQAAPFVTFTPKGKRKARGWVEGHRPYLLILAGHGRPDPDGIFDETNDQVGDGVTFRTGRYSSCDPRWETDFDARIDPYIAANPGVVVADYRHTKPAPAAVAPPARFRAWAVYAVGNGDRYVATGRADDRGQALLVAESCPAELRAEYAVPADGIIARHGPLAPTE